MMKNSRKAIIFPDNVKILSVLGENIKLAYKRRNLSQSIIAKRTGLSRLTVRKVENGDPTVSIGHYVNVLAVVNLAEDFAKVALDDELGRKLQDIELLK